MPLSRAVARLGALYALVAVAVLNSCSHLAGRLDSGATASPRTINFATAEATYSYVDVSPDGRMIVFDLLGDLYLVPVTGGEASPLTSGRAWDLMPRYSPDGTRIAFLSDRSGSMNLWAINVDGTNIVQYTKEGGTVALPMWTRTGDLVVSTVGNQNNRKTIRMANPTEERAFPVYLYPSAASISPDGGSVYQGINHRGKWAIIKIDLRTGDTTDLRVNGALPQISPDGKWLAYVNEAAAGDLGLTPGLAGSPKSLVLRNLATGEEREIVDSLAGGGRSETDPAPGYAFTPDGRGVVLSRLGRLTRVDIATGEKRIIPLKVQVVREVGVPVHVPVKLPDGGEVEAKIIRWPTVRPSSEVVVFSAFGKIYATDIRSGKSRRLTVGDDFEFAPSLSPDGRLVAYTTWSDVALGHVMVVPVEGGAPQQVTTEPRRYVNPAWSPDGSRLAFVADTSPERMGLYNASGEGVMLYWTPSDGSRAPSVIRDVTPLFASQRYYPVPTFSGDGERVFVVGRTPGSVRSAQVFSMRLDGRDVVTHLILPNVDEAVVSPDGKRIAVVWRDRLYVENVPARSASNDTARFSADSAQLITESAPVYVGWQDGATLTWAITDRVYRATITRATTERIAEIDIRRPRPRPDGTYAFTHARLITMRGSDVIEDGTLVFTGNRISALGKSSEVKVPTDAIVLDVSGKTILPGLHDVHAHVNRTIHEVWQRQNYNYIGSLAYGVTTTYDPAARSLDVFGQSEMAAVGEVLAPRIYSSGDVIMGEGSGSLPEWREIATLDDARRIIEHRRRYSPSLLKEYAYPRRDQRQWLIRAARELGAPMTAEGRDRVLDLTLVADGYTAFEHTIPAAPLYADVYQFLAATRVHYTPTLMVAGNGYESYFGRREDLENDARLRRFIPESYLDRFKPFRERWNAHEEARLIEASRAVASVAKAGGLVSAGSHGVLPGLGVHWEMWGFVLGGMTPLEALRSATLIPAKKLGLDGELGSIEVGKVADLVVLDANPLESIRNSTSVRYVILNGFVYDGPSMTCVWPSRKELVPWPWQSEEQRKRFAASRVGPS